MFESGQVYPIKVSGIFRLTAAKRGKRAGLHHDYSERGEAVYLEHSQHGLCWLASEYEPPEKRERGRPTKDIPFIAFRETLEQSAQPLSKAGLAKALADKYEMSQRSVERRVTNLISNGTLRSVDKGGLEWTG